MLLTLEHHVPQLLSQLQFSQVLFQGLGDGISGSQLIQDHGIVPAHGGQAVQEEDQLLEHLRWGQGWRLKGTRPGASSGVFPMHPLWYIGAGAIAVNRQQKAGRHKGWVDLENPTQTDKEKAKRCSPFWGA